MKIGLFGTGAYGMALSSILTDNKCSITMWTKFAEEKEHLETTRQNEKLIPNFKIDNNILEETTCQKTHSRGDKILWRMIGSMENIETSSGEKGARIKLIRNDSIGPWSWDSSESSINRGLGVNEWSESDMKTILNEYYYNGLSNQTCPVSYSNTSLPCDFSKIKFPENAKSMIEEVVWNTGSNEVEISFEKIKTSKFYEYERSNNTGKNCSSVKYCNDDIERTIKWTGKIGLSYPSDYGYATSGGSKINRETCLNTNLYDWYEDMFDSSTIRGISDCYQNDWFYNNGIPQYFMTPYAESNNNSLVFLAYYGKVFIKDASDSLSYDNASWSRPTIYLKNEVKIIEGIGTSDNPYVLK